MLLKLQVGISAMSFQNQTIFLKVRQDYKVDHLTVLLKNQQQSDFSCELLNVLH